MSDDICLRKVIRHKHHDVSSLENSLANHEPVALPSQTRTLTTYTVITRRDGDRHAMLRREIRSGIVDSLVFDGLGLEVCVCRREQVGGWGASISPVSLMTREWGETYNESQTWTSILPGYSAR